MANERTRDIKKFLSDPAYKDDREFMDAYFTDFLERQQAAAEERRKKNDQDNANIFDKIFGGL